MLEKTQETLTKYKDLNRNVFYEYLQMIVSFKDSLEKYYDFHYNKQVDSAKYEIMKRCR
jgi:hypothetical protein